jgi:hypothetical protein
VRVTEVLKLSLQIALGIAFPALVIKKDLARLGPLPLSRAWNDASLWSAIVAFGPISLIVHFTRTRRSFLGLALGLGWALASMLVSALGASAFEL